MDEKRISILMEMLEISREEAIQVLEDDARIDRGEKLFELTPEQKKAEKKARSGAKSENAVNAYGKKVTRTRKADTDKGELIQAISNALQDLGSVEKLTVTNKEREMELFYNGRKFKIVLSAPRK